MVIAAATAAAAAVHLFIDPPPWTVFIDYESGSVGSIRGAEWGRFWVGLVSFDGWLCVHSQMATVSMVHAINCFTNRLFWWNMEYRIVAECIWNRSIALMWLNDSIWMYGYYSKLSEMYYPNSRHFQAKIYWSFIYSGRDIECVLSFSRPNFRVILMQKSIKNLESSIRLIVLDNGIVIYCVLLVHWLEGFVLHFQLTWNYIRVIWLGCLPSHSYFVLVCTIIGICYHTVL